jgi:arylsulfatase
MESRLRISLLLLLACTLRAHAPVPEKRPPNIILIFMDDLGYGDLSCYGALDIRTPNLDRMASEGIRFTNFLSAQAVCSASRAGLLTGCYPNRIGISGALFPRAKVGLSHDETTMAEMLKSQGYATGAFGKWHLGDAPEFLPLRHGFDEYLGIPYSNDMWPVDFSGKPVDTNHRKAQFPPLPVIRGEKVVDTIADLEDQATLTSRWTDAAIDFIRRNRQQPFFAYIPHSMPHVPINASAAFRGKSRQGLYGDVIQEVDHHVGRILETLRELRLDQNTLVIFTSDNGPWLNFGNHAGNAGGFREGKGTSFEGGQRVPCLMRWKGTLPAGLVANQLSSTIDILPTLAGITGAKLPEKKIDGVDIGAILEGDMTATPRRTFNYYYRTNALEAVRRDHWKLVFAHPSRSYIGQAPGVDGYPGPSPENVPMREALYDLRRDPGEQYDVSAQHPDILNELKAYAEEVRRELGDDLQKVMGTGNRLSGRLR